MVSCAISNEINASTDYHDYPVYYSELASSGSAGASPFNMTSFPTVKQLSRCTIDTVTYKHCDFDMAGQTEFKSAEL